MRYIHRSSWRRFALGTLCLAGIPFITACDMQQRRVDVPTASGADASLNPEFGLTADAQDPSERDKELGYGKWKAKPEPTGTRAPTSPTRRGSAWNTVD